MAKTRIAGRNAAGDSRLPTAVQITEATSASATPALMAISGSRSRNSSVAASPTPISIVWRTIMKVAPAAKAAATRPPARTPGVEAAGPSRRIRRANQIAASSATPASPAAHADWRVLCW